MAIPYLLMAMQADGLDWGANRRPAVRQALAEIIQGRMAENVNLWLAGLDGNAARDRRNGTYLSWFEHMRDGGIEGE